jgi:hypothetical protein
MCVVGSKKGNEREPIVYIEVIVGHTIYFFNKWYSETESGINTNSVLGQLPY